MGALEPRRDSAVPSTVAGLGPDLGNGLSIHEGQRPDSVQHTPVGGSGVASDTREWAPDDKGPWRGSGEASSSFHSHQPGLQEVSEANDISSGLSQISIVSDSQGYYC